ncbi:Acetyl-coenzyme A carboxylase carboxyl transferase subunit beta OS=Lysinibacillus sphaericus OX=1421 GN=accD PE=3 SV=1 [Lysinibacillus sphaericus]
MTGLGTLDGEEIVVAIMDSHFRMGSMGSVVGEKITRAVEKATALRVTIYYFYCKWWRTNAGRCLIVNANGKNECGVKTMADSDQGLLFISILTHPTTGGVSASFASVGDINMCRTSSTNRLCW